MKNHRSKDEEYDEDDDCDDPPQQRQRFRLSGIAQIGEWREHGFLVPWDRDAAVVGMPKRQKRIAIVQPVTLPELLDETDNESKLTGVPIHSRCWTLIQRVVGSEEAEQHLECLLQALQLRQLDNPFDLRNYACAACLTDQCYCRCHCCRFRSWPDSDESISYLKDPINILAVRDLLVVAPRRDVEDRVKYKTRHWWHDFSSMISARRHYIGSNIPLDIKILIMGYLGPKDTENMLTAFQWVIPDSYWQSRFPRTLIFEIESLIASSKDVDWQYLSLHAQSLVETSHELRNRRRILTVLEGTKRIFYDMLATMEEKNQEQNVE